MAIGGGYDRTMHAMVLTKPAAIESSPLSLEELPEPIPGPGEVRVKVRCCGVCRTDLHVCEGELPPQTAHITPGHQVVGVVDRIGPDCRRFKVGDRVGIAWLRFTCGVCRFCTSGRENLCPNARFTGYHAPGGYAEFALVNEAFAYALPAGLDDLSAAPLLCAGIIGFRALRQADVRPGCRVGMYGFGSSAHIAIQVALHWGCKVFVSTRDAAHQRLALELGATWAGPASAAPPEKCDSSILFAPVGELVPAAMEALEQGGTLAIAGIYLSDIPRLNYERQLFHEKSLRSVTANTRDDGRDLLKLAVEIPLRPRTTVFPLKAANTALQKLKHDAIDGSAVLAVDEAE
jgi:alcohol dehydrogenase, propanol-preferring